MPERDTAFSICHCGVGLFLEVFVEPVDEVTVPEEAVLGMEHPVGLVGEVEVAGIEAAELGGVVGSHALGGYDTEVELAVDNAYRGVPFVDKEMGRIGIGVGSLGIFDPIRAAEVPIGEPVFLGFEALLLEVEHAVVGEEGFETVALVVTCQPVDAVCTE